MTDILTIVKEQLSKYLKIKKQNGCNNRSVHVWRRDRQYATNLGRFGLAELAVQGTQADAQELGDLFLAFEGIAVAIQEFIDLLLLAFFIFVVAGACVSDLVDDVLRKIFQGHSFVIAEVGGIFDHVLKFSHVARPIVGEEEVLHVLSDVFQGGVEFFFQGLDIVQTDRQNVLPSLSQGRKLHLDDTDPIEEVLAKTSFLDHLTQVLVGGGDDADIELDLFGRSDPFQFVLLKNSKKFGLHGQRHFSKLIEEEGPSLCHLELSGLSALFCSGERTFFVAEEFTFKEVFGDTRTVDGDEGVLFSLALLVDRPCHKLFAGSCLSRDQDGCRAVGELGDKFLDGFDVAALSNDGVDGA